MRIGQVGFAAKNRHDLSAVATCGLAKRQSQAPGEAICKRHRAAQQDEFIATTARLPSLVRQAIQRE
ncbi:hypothetical protein [Pectobacterium colocasium]|uniref:hypothetical protein n=1 Tax=Pectobacterium colocasium TaxID=2878098 RepID=UPI001CD37DDC|nr:hypothetical protein [Pectobacterium colocasium]